MANQVEGLNELVSLFRRAASIKPELKKAVHEVATNVSAEARSLAPSPIRGLANIKDEASGRDVIVSVETKSVFGAIMEFGSPTLPGGRPFMLPALELHEDELEPAVVEVMSRWINS